MPPPRKRGCRSAAAAGGGGGGAWKEPEEEETERWLETTRCMVVLPSLPKTKGGRATALPAGSRASSLPSAIRSRPAASKADGEDDDGRQGRGGWAGAERQPRPGLDLPLPAVGIRRNAERIQRRTRVRERIQGKRRRTPQYKFHSIIHIMNNVRGLHQAWIKMEVSMPMEHSLQYILIAARRHISIGIVDPSTDQYRLATLCRTDWDTVLSLCFKTFLTFRCHSSYADFSLSLEVSVVEVCTVNVSHGVVPVSRVNRQRRKQH
ncbi:hypothetical protein EYD10_16413 [Varanus komodoensis]|nr:hypothetical protein EYD10_16413 [Varanus komodoensis]